jgi:membrane protein YdbS with pleckstrin-like domain
MPGVCPDNRPRVKRLCHEWSGHAVIRRRRPSVCWVRGCPSVAGRITVSRVGYSRRLLNPGEQVLVDVRPHWWYLAGPVSLLVLVIAGAIAAFVESASKWLSWLVLVALGLAALWLAARYVRWVTSRLIVTDTRVIERRGIVARSGREIPLAALTDIGYRQTIFERVIGAGNVVLESAGRRSQEVFPDLPNPAYIHNVIFRQMQVNRQQSASWSGPAADSIPSQIEQLDQLRRRGVITDAEFEAKKVELLDRL